MTFQFTSGPSFILTFITIAGYAFYIRAPFSEVWVGLVTLFGLHVGKRLIKSIKVPNAEVSCEDTKG